MNAANNLVLTNIGPAVADHDRQTMNELVTKQDLYNMGVHIDSNFGKVISEFTIVDSQFVNLRTDMNAGFSNLRTDMDSQFIKFRAEMSDQFGKVYTMFGTAQVELNKTLFKFGSLFFTMMIAIMGIDRWWR